MKKLLIYTDSRGQHTPRGQYHDVFAVRLAKRGDIEVDLLLCPMKWTTTIDFLDHLSRVPANTYDHIILQTGIVDWSPRPQPSAINDLYDNKTTANLGNDQLNTRDYSKKVVNNKKRLFDDIFTEKEMLAHLSKDFGVAFEGHPTINMYSLEMAEKYLIPRLCAIENLLFINSNRFVPGWKGDHARGRPANIGITEDYSALFRDALGPEKVIDLLGWNHEDIQRYTCDNIHLTEAGSEFIYEEICRRLKLDSAVLSVSHAQTPNLMLNPISDQPGASNEFGNMPEAALVDALGRPIQAPRNLSSAEKLNCLREAGLKPNDKLATLIIGLRLHQEDDIRTENLLFLLSWIDRYYGDLFDVLIVEQDKKPKIELISRHFKPYVRHEFLYNPGAYNRGWGYNVAVRNFTKAPVVALMDTDILPGANFVQEVVDCHSKYKAVSPYTNIYFTDPQEALEITRSYSFSSLTDLNNVHKPTTITGGVVIIRRSTFDELAGFEQYTEYGGEDRALDVTLLNHCDSSEIRMAPYIYVHLHHPNGKVNHSNLNQILSHLEKNYGCVVDRTLTAKDFIHKNCSHVSPEQTGGNIIKRRPTYGDPNLYRSGRPLTINGCYKDSTTEAVDRVLFPPEFKNLDDYEEKEFYKAPDPDTDRIAAFYNAFKGKRCFIIGNGPSLNKHDLSLLKDEYVFAVNSFFYKTDETGFKPTFFVVEDNAVMQENIERIRAYEVPFKFFPTNYKRLHPEGDNVYFFRMNRGFYEKSSPNYCVPRFSTDASKVLYCGQSVTYINLQLAYFMGFTEVYLIGMDFDYQIPSSHERRGDLIISTTDDPNHFHKDYFGKGKTWKDPKLDRVAMNYRQAKLVYEAVGRKIYNATIGGKLEIFERVDYDRLLRGDKGLAVSGQGKVAAGQTPLAQPASLERQLAQPRPKTSREEKAASSFPVSISLSVRLRRWARRRYDVFAKAVKARSLVLFRMGQLVVWSLRAARRHPISSAGFLLVVALLAALPAYAPLWPYRAWFWAGAVLAGFAGAGMALFAAAHKALQRLLDIQAGHVAAAARVARQTNEQRLAELEKRNATLKAEIDAAKKTAKAGDEALKAEIATAVEKAIESRMGTVESQIITVEEALESRIETVESQITTVEEAIESRIGTVESQITIVEEALESQMGTVENQIATIDPNIEDALIDSLNDPSLSTQKKFEIILELANSHKSQNNNPRAMHYYAQAKKISNNNFYQLLTLAKSYLELNQKEVALDLYIESLFQLMQTGNDLNQKMLDLYHSTRGKVTYGKEHGHELIIKYIKSNLDFIKSQADHKLTLIEIGSTREDVPGQGSTEKLARFCQANDLHFITVDMDPRNTKLAHVTLAGINKEFEAINQKGEDFLRDYSGPMDFVFLDAYDFDHGKHSEERQSRYERFLGKRISDEQCHKMHLECAQQIVDKISNHGAVCIDDTWYENGEWKAKGATAVPYLLSNSFCIILTGNRSVLLKKTSSVFERSCD